MLVTPPSVGVVVWFNEINEEQPWPAVVTRCLDTSFLVKVLGNDGGVRCAELHQLSTFECNLTNAIVFKLSLHIELGVACTYALEHANSKSGNHAQRIHLASKSFTNFLTILCTEIDEFPPAVGRVQNNVAENLPAAVHSAMEHVDRIAVELDEKTHKLSAAKRDAIDATLFELAKECAARACRTHKEQMVRLSQCAKEEFRICSAKRKEAAVLLQNAWEINGRDSKRKNQVPFSKENKRAKLACAGEEGFIEEEVLDESGFDLREGERNLEDAQCESSYPSSATHYRKKVVDVGRAYEVARDRIGVQMVSNRYVSGSLSGNREDAFKADLVAYLEENGEEKPRTMRMGGVKVNPYKVFVEVVGRGGIEAVIGRREVSGVLRSIGHGSNDKGTRLKGYYMQYLYHYEMLLVSGEGDGRADHVKFAHEEKGGKSQNGKRPIVGDGTVIIPRRFEKCAAVEAPKLDIYQKAAHNLGRETVSRSYVHRNVELGREVIFMIDLQRFLVEMGVHAVFSETERAIAFELCEQVLRNGGITTVGDAKRFAKICARLGILQKDVEQVQHFYRNVLQKYENRLVHQVSSML